MPPEQALFIMTDEMSNHLDQHFLKLFKAMLLDAVGKVDEEDMSDVEHNPDHNGCC
jgi:HD-GYP domain-containing protein (c-di-GMP phosphodiesterase class II)